MATQFRHIRPARLPRHDASPDRSGHSAAGLVRGLTSHTKCPGWLPDSYLAACRAVQRNRSGVASQRVVLFGHWGPTKEAAMTGPSKRPDTRLLGAGHMRVPFPRSCVPRRRPRAQTRCRCRRCRAVGSRPPAAGEISVHVRGAARASARQQTSLLGGGLGSIGYRRVAVQHRGIRVDALVVARPPPSAKLPAQL